MDDSYLHPQSYIHPLTKNLEVLENPKATLIVGLRTMHGGVKIIDVGFLIFSNLKNV